MKTPFYYAMVLMTIPLVSAGKKITEDSGPCVLKRELNTAINIMLGDPDTLPSLVGNIT